MEDRTSWYDGLFYRLMIDPIAGKRLAGPVGKCVEEGSSIIDIGSGTGSLVLALAPRCRRAVGVDLSSKMVRYAAKRLASRARLSRAEFFHVDGAGMAERFQETFDYAIITQVLHEVRPEVRAKIIAEARKIARMAIIVDFAAPFPRKLFSRFVRLVELSAGKEHNKNFREWYDAGGIDGFVRREGLTVQAERLLKPGVVKIVKATFGNHHVN
jgi:SAM-dependent methyltransferase